ncbi:hypothetical protein QTJ16_004933 [Diplocarpon rosae]|uniref:Uncharacterized protein n=1 Tax=Diplocarpon rosae TaxID=946125 RepID=A0AAD9WDQ1_9HELO|nr:hypothetical protein QTJ16_004933 [Diplocarpon rosae]
MDIPPRPRGRARSKRVESNPLECPVTPEEQQLAAIVRGILQEEEKAKKSAVTDSETRLTSAPDAVLSSTPCSVAPETLPSSPSPKKHPRYLPINMNYQNYIDSPGGLASNSRQAPPSPSQGMPHTNGMNGGMSMGGGMVGYPTPAGHQSDLNYVMSMVEELSAVLRANQQLTAGVVDKMGKVREKASHLNLNNDELVAAVASELNEDSKNLEKENSSLRNALEKCQYDKNENWKLAVHGANILADITEKMHHFKEQHETDTLAWHKNYRKQLADEREENLKLRNQINDMKAAACRANGHLRDMRRYLADHDELHQLRVQNVRYRQERRFWKRKALPLVPDDDSEWSNDDDLIDPEEKKRQEAALAEKNRKDTEAAGDEGASA